MDEKKGKMNKKKAVFSPSKTHGKSSFLKIKQQIFNELFFDESAKNQSCNSFIIVNQFVMLAFCAHLLRLCSYPPTAVSFSLSKHAKNRFFY